MQAAGCLPDFRETCWWQNRTRTDWETDTADALIKARMEVPARGACQYLYKVHGVGIGEWSPGRPPYTCFKFAVGRVCE